MNNKGFTLVELIVTIGIMALVGVVIAANMTGMFAKEEDNSVEAFKKQLEDAACILSERATYRNLCQSGCTINASELISNGLIDENIKDPRNNTKIKDGGYQVKITWQNKVKTCKFSE